jgi:peptide/nickel transport system substrate-binding protein
MDHVDRHIAHPLSRRTVLQVFATGAGMALLAACGSPAAPPAAPAPTVGPVPTAAPTAGAVSSAAATPVPTSAPTTASVATSTSAAPKTGGTLRLGQVGDINNLEPDYNQKVTSPVVWLAYDRISQYDLQLNPQPMLAESWDLSPDYKQITLHLRKGVTWHSGRDFTSDDVKYTIQRVTDPKVGSGQYAAQAKAFSSVDTPDKYTVVIKANTPQPLLFDFFEQVNIVDKDTAGSSAAPQTTVGTGAFQLTEWVQGDHVTLVKNKNYWQPGKPYLDGITLTVFKDAQAMVTQLESGALDVIRQPTIPDAFRLKTNDTFQVLTHPSGGQAYVLGANVTTPGLEDKRVRQALNYAINRDRFVNTVLSGLSTVQDLPWPQTSPAYEANKATLYRYDLDKAKSLMSQAGASNLSFDIIPQDAEPSGKQFSEMIQADFAQLGVKLNIVTLTGASWNTAVIGRDYKGFYYTTQSYLNMQPGTPLTGAVFRPGNNNSGFRDDMYEQLVGSTTTEPDPAKLKQIYSQLNDIILDQSFAMYPGLTAVTCIVRKTFHDLTPTMSGGWWIYTDTWMG